MLLAGVNPLDGGGQRGEPYVAQAAKDHELIVRFMSLFAKLRDMSDDEPARIEELSRSDESFRKLCLDLSYAVGSVKIAERSQRALFAAPVDPQFKSAWRDYGQRFDRVLAGVFLDHLGFIRPSADENLDPEALALDHAEDSARETANAIEAVFDFAEKNIGDYSDSAFVEQIELGLLEWKRLQFELGFDVRQVLTRRNLVPFVLIPRHVATKHSPSQTLSLFEHLKQAHEAFVFGTPLAALALLRSILELVLENHYHSHGKNLNEQINGLTRLPAGVSLADLHAIRLLANAVLHFKKEASMPEDIEPQMIKHLDVLRRLIEDAPGMPSAPLHLVRR
jgi:hypothetical protein